MPRHPNQEPLTVNERREAIVRAAKKRGAKLSFLPGRFGSWYEDRMVEREEQMRAPVEERDGHFRTVKNGDFSEDEIRSMEKLYGATIKRPGNLK